MTTVSPSRKENVLVTGGAGYIGSHAVAELIRAGHAVTVVDNLCRGHREAVHGDAEFHQIDLHETAELARILQDEEIDCVMHFAAYALVAESVVQPLAYYRNNTAGTLSLLQAMQRSGVKRLVFSSTCATYGIPETSPITEDAPQRPINPYGRSKLMVELALRDLAAADDSFGCVALRYFNVAGCAFDGTLGEDHDPETHVIPLLLQTALGQREKFSILGDDYPTPDGTCIRDYIHVEDLCRAHRLALSAIEPGQTRFYNVGLGHGYSVKEIVAAVQRVTGRRLPIDDGPRRPGDPPELVADPARIRDELNWHPQHTDLDDIVATAWNWFRRFPSGYAEQSTYTPRTMVRAQ